MSSKRQMRDFTVIMVAVVLACALLLAQVYFLDTGSRNISAKSETLFASSRLRESATRLLAAIEIAKTAERRYVLNGGERDLPTVVGAAHDLSTRLRELIKLAQETGQDARALEIEALGNKWLSQLQNIGAASAQSIHEGDSLRFATAAPGSGEDALRESVDALHILAGETQRGLLASIHETGRRLRLGAYGTGILLLTLAALSLSLGRNWMRIQIERHRHTTEQFEARAAELSDLSRHLLATREEEKAKIARELHDELGSSLTAVNMDLAWVRQHLQDPALALRLNRAAEVLTNTVRMKRRMIHDLTPTALDNLGLAAAVESYAADFSERIGIPIEVDVPEELPELKKGCPIAIFRIIQEALTNVSLHAAATSIKVRLHHDDQTIVVEIFDDGVGFAPATRKPESYGILEMRERAHQAGGMLEIIPAPEGRGSIVQARLPCVAAS